MEQSEKAELYSRLSALETSVSGLQKTIVVGGSLVGVFLSMVLLVGSWYLNYTFTRQDALYSAVIGLQGRVEYADERFGTHTGDVRNHPDNTARVDQLVSDRIKMEAQMERIQDSLKDILIAVSQDE